jgi:hypothetical protein
LSLNSYLSPDKLTGSLAAVGSPATGAHLQTIMALTQQLDISNRRLSDNRGRALDNDPELAPLQM